MAVSSFWGPLQNTKKPKQLTFEDHQEIGQTLTRWEIDLVHISCKILNAYPRQREIQKICKTLDCEISHLQNILDPEVTSDKAYDNYPVKTYEERLTVYFGLSREKMN